MRRFSGVIFAIVILTISACSIQGETKQLESPSSHADEQILLAESQLSNVQVTGTEQPSTGMIKPIVITVEGNSKSFDWENVANPTFYPELSVTDLDQDQHQELVIFLTTGYGTGVMESKAYVLKEDLSEISLPEPKDDALPEFSNSLMKNEENRTYIVTVAGQSATFTYNEEDAGLWFDQAVVGNSVSYRIDNELIIASVSVQVSPAMVIGSIEVPYRLVNDTFIREAISFIPYD